MWAPSTAAAVLHFLFAGRGSQEELPQWVEQFTNDQDTVGAMLMALSALRQGGFRQSEFSADLLQGLLDAFPQWVNVNRNAGDYRLAEAGNDGFCQNQSM